MAETTVTKSAPGKKNLDPANSHLRREVAEHYEVVNWHGGHEQNFGKFGIVNLKTLTMTQANKLVTKEFSKLIAKK